MDKKKLKQYRSFQKLIPKLQDVISDLYSRLEDVPEVSGKVTKSSDDFPYIEEHLTVRIPEPKEATAIKVRIREKEQRLKGMQQDAEAVERFIEGIEDNQHRQMFEMLYINDDKISQCEIGDMLGYSQGRISQIISEYLKD